MSSTSVLQGCQIGVSRKSVLQACQVRVSYKTAKQGVSYKSVKQECLTTALRNSVKQGCPTRVSPQCVNSGCRTSEFAGNVTNKYCLCLSTYVSAFGFVGFMLFFYIMLWQFGVKFWSRICFRIHRGADGSVEFLCKKWLGNRSWYILMFVTYSIL